MPERADFPGDRHAHAVSGRVHGRRREQGRPLHAPLGIDVRRDGALERDGECDDWGIEAPAMMRTHVMVKSRLKLLWVLPVLISVVLGGCPVQDTSGSMVELAVEIDGTWQIRSPNVLGATCITINASEVVRNDDGCDGISEPTSKTSQVVVDGSSVFISWTFLLPASGNLGQESLNLSVLADGSMVATTTFVTVDGDTGRTLGSPRVESVVVTRTQ